MEGRLAIVFFVVPLVVIPSMTSTIVSAWTDRALDAERLNLRKTARKLRSPPPAWQTTTPTRSERTGILAAGVYRARYIRASGCGLPRHSGRLAILECHCRRPGPLGDWRFGDSKLTQIRSMSPKWIAAHYRRIMTQDI